MVEIGKTEFGQEKVDRNPAGIFRFAVYLEEYEPDWGMRIDEIYFFKSEQDAHDYVRMYREKYCSGQGWNSGWYMIASFYGYIPAGDSNT